MMGQTVLPNGMTVAEINPYETQFVYTEIFVQKLYFAHGIKVQPGDVILDAGSNIGLFALFLFSQCNPGRVYCFEPAPECLAALRHNLAPFGDRAVIADAALGDTEGEAAFTYYPGYSIMSGLFAEPARDLDVLKAGARAQFARKSGHGLNERMMDRLVMQKLDAPISFRCPVTTVSRVIEQHGLDRIHLLKVDVERAEGAILRGIEDAHWPRIDQVVAEVHDQGEAEHEAMRDLLISKGFETVMTVEEGLENSGIYAISARRPKAR